MRLQRYIYFGKKTMYCRKFAGKIIITFSPQKIGDSVFSLFQTIQIDFRKLLSTNILHYSAKEFTKSASASAVLSKISKDRFSALSAGVCVIDNTVSIRLDDVTAIQGIP